MIKNILKDFLTVPRHILNLIAAIFCIQIIDASAFILFNYYLKDLGYTDESIASLTAFRYAAIVLCAFPFGLYIKGRRLVPFFKFGALSIPTCMLSILLILELGYFSFVYPLMFLFGVCIISMKVTALPFIMLNTPKEKHTEALTLFFQIFSFTAFVAGLTHYTLSSIDPIFFTERTTLVIFGIGGYSAFYFINKINIQENLSEQIPFRTLLKVYEWQKIFRASIPNLLIAIGAGLTIPFLNLFFLNIHGLESHYFAFYGSFSFVLVTLMMFFVPYIRRRYGYNISINGFQLLAVVALFVMASTEWYAHWEWAAGVAIVAFLLRQPLMNVASPAASELALYYVGEKNQEMMGALNASIWAGSWFFSSVIFGILRAYEISYVYIFMMTVVIYLIATFQYYLLIKEYKAQEEDLL